MWQDVTPSRTLQTFLEKLILKKIETDLKFASFSILYFIFYILYIYAEYKNLNPTLKKILCPAVTK